MLEKLTAWDKSLFLQLNNTHNSFLNFLMPWISNKFIWIPLYVWLLYLLFKYNKQRELLVVLSIGLLILISDQIASGFLKPMVARLRPCYDPEISPQTLLIGGCGGKYGFASSHASNSFAVAMFCWLAIKPYFKYSWLLFVWAAIVAYSRIYLGVHYPGDVIMGALIGVSSALAIFTLFQWATKRLWPKPTPQP